MINPQKIKNAKKERRKARTRAKISGTAKVPRLSVFRSLNHISAQLIDDEKGETLTMANDLELGDKIVKQMKNKKIANTENTDSESSVIAGKVLIAYEVGKLLAKKALAKKIKKSIFDKSRYKYHGRVKAVADGARTGGLKF